MARIKEWEELTICDNFLFQKVMQNRRLCKRLIQKLLKIKVRNIIYPVAEKSIAIGAVSKSVRLDLYVETDTGTIIDIEIQTTDGADGWLPKRTRYYQSMIDLEVLGKGMDYIELKKSFVIFICTFDPFDLGEKVYTFSNICHEKAELELGDETTKIFLNAKGTRGNVDKDIESFLSYVDGKAAEGKFAQAIAAEVERVKQHNETRVEYMTLMMELKQQRREGYNEGKAEGKAEGQDSERLNSIRNLMESLHLTAQQAMDALKIPVKEQSKYASQI